MRAVRRSRSVVSLALALVVGAATGVRAQQGGPDLATLIPAYVRDPQTYRPQVVAAARSAPPGLPPMVRLAFADAYVRSGLVGSARELLVGIVDEQPGAPAAEWAYLALGWLQFAAADFSGARLFYEHAETTSLGQPIAEVVLGLIDATQRRTGPAIDRLERAAESPATAPMLRPVARLGIGYARYWAGDFESAAGEFEHVAGIDADSPFADDAAYGAAWSRWCAGHQDQAIERLRALAEQTVHGTNPRHVGRSLIQLRPAALVRASFKRYQQAPIGAPAEQLVALLDADGAGLARAALASIDEHQADDGTGEAATDERSARPVDRPAPTAPPPGTRPSPQAVPERAPASSSTWPWLAAALLLALMLVLASRSRSGSRRLH